jgi:hypothetical protein
VFCLELDMPYTVGEWPQDFALPLPTHRLASPR